MATYNGRVHSGGLNLRTSDSTSSSSPIQIPNGMDIVVSDYSQNSSWYCTTYGGYSGFVMKSYVNIISNVSTRSCSVTGGGLNLRLYPGTAAPSPIQIPDGRALTVQQHNGTWSSTTYGGYSGFVMTQYLTGSSGGGDGGATGTYTALICQGDTDSASDARLVYNTLTSKYGSGAVAYRGFNLNNNTPNNPCANNSNFNEAKGYDVLYWTGHGNSTPKLNVIKGPSFNAYDAANSNWTSTSNRLKAPIFSACSLFDGSTNRSRWAGIMRKSDIQVMLGYHATAPGTGRDDDIARDFFSLCAAGNSCMYSWKNANTPNTGNNYLTLVYNDDNRCYYRLPGYPGLTYAAPNRSTTKIFAYASFATGGTQINSLAAPLSERSDVLLEMPYELEIIAPTVKPMLSMEADSAIANSKVIKDETTGAYFVSFGEASPLPVEEFAAQNANMAYAINAFGDQLQADALVKHYNDVMMEVLDDESEGPQTVIGHTTQFLNHFNGIPLERNCIVVSSDANGINAVTNHWVDVAPIADTARVLQQDAIESVFAGEAARKLARVADVESADYVYVLRDGRYVLQRDVRMNDGNRVLVDALTNSITE